MGKKAIRKATEYTTSRNIFNNGIFFDSNEHHVQWLRVNWRKIKKLNRYPDNANAHIAEKLAAFYLSGFKKENIYFGAGSIEIIQTIFRTFTHPKSTVLLFDPSYAIYQFNALIAGLRCQVIPLEKNFEYPISALLKKKLNNIDVIFIGSPNNPTGTLLKKSDAEALLKRFKGILVIDEAYIEYAGMSRSLVNLAKKRDNIIIVRTFSKAWGLAGIRVGYAVANKRVIERLLAVKNPYNISAVAQEVISQALEKQRKLRKTVAQNNKLKTELVVSLRALGFEVTDTSANFVLVKVDDPERYFYELGKYNIIVRYLKNSTRMREFLRISVSSKKNNKQLLRVMKKICEKA